MNSKLDLRRFGRLRLRILRGRHQQQSRRGQNEEKHFFHNYLLLHLKKAIRVKASPGWEPLSAKLQTQKRNATPLVNCRLFEVKSSAPKRMSVLPTSNRKATGRVG